MLKLAIDNGGSGTRVSYKGNGDKMRFTHASYCKEVDLENVLYTDSSDPLGDFILQSPAIKNRRFTYDDVSKRYNGKVLAYDPTELKVNSDVFYVNFARAVARAIEQDGYSDKIKACFTLPISLYFREDVRASIVEKVAGDYVVFATSHDVEYKFTIGEDNIKFSPEDYLVYVNRLDTIPDELYEGVGLLLGIGEISTEVLPIIGGEVALQASSTLNVAGTKVLDYIRRELLDAGYPHSTVAVNTAIEKGYIVSQGKKVDVGDLVIKSKTKLAEELADKIQKSLNASNLTINDIGYITMVGRLFYPAAEGTGDMVEFMLNALGTSPLLLIGEATETNDRLALLQLLVSADDK